MSDNRPIGVFDSGLGGLTVVREIFHHMPNERVVYLGDTARIPYGTRSVETISRFAMQDARFLLDLDIKMLIVACNTASSVALQAIRSSVHEIPVIGVVQPGAIAAVRHSADKKIGVIGTRATVLSQAYTHAIHEVCPDARVFGKECPLFVPLVEEGLIQSDIAHLTAQHYLYELKDHGIDTLILGCTHYPLLLEVIQETVGSAIELIDSAMWTSREAKDILEALGARSQTPGASMFYISDLSPQFESMATRFLGREVPEIKLISLDSLTQYT